MPLGKKVGSSHAPVPEVNSARGLQQASSGTVVSNPLTTDGVHPDECMQPSSCWCLGLMALYGAASRGFCQSCCLKGAQAPIAAISKHPSGFIKLVFTREMEAAASNVEEIALEETSQYLWVVSHWLPVFTGIFIFLFYRCFKPVLTTTRTNIDPFLVWAWAGKPPYSGEIRCNIYYWLLGLYLFSTSYPFSTESWLQLILRRADFLHTVVSFTQLFASRETGSTSRLNS